ncbi:hypothetical protein H4R24_000920 [Coemansia sp. RSA 988]|nr:hypothetical protein H4R24_000920 [Coemansia sp. RSA 988]
MSLTLTAKAIWMMSTILLVAGAIGAAIVLNDPATAIDVGVWAVSSEHSDNNSNAGKHDSSESISLEYSSGEDAQRGYNSNDEDDSDTNSQQPQPSQPSMGSLDVTSTIHGANNMILDFAGEDAPAE